MSKYCCSTFKEFILLFKWFSFIDDNGEKKFSMPCIPNAEKDLRVNHCPSCGNKIRSIILSEKEIIQAYNSTQNKQ